MVIMLQNPLGTRCIFLAAYNLWELESVCLCASVSARCVMTWQAESTALSDKLHYSIPSPDLPLSCFTLLIPIGGCKPSRELNSSHKILPLWAAETGEPEVPFVCRCQNTWATMAPFTDSLEQSVSEQRGKVQHMELNFRQSCNGMN